MTEEILSLMEKRRRCKCQGDHNNYKRLQKLIRIRVRRAKNEWLKGECEELEELQSKHDEFNLHKKLKEVSGVYRKKNHSVLVNDNNEIVTNKQEKEIIWIKYIEDLFSDDRPSREEETNNNEITGPPIIKEEIVKAIQDSKINRATGPD